MIGVLQSRAINCTEGTVKEGKVGELPSMQKKKKKKYCTELSLKNINDRLRTYG